MFYITRYSVKAEGLVEYQKWLLSDEAKDLYKRLEKETGWKYKETYFPILGFGDDHVEDWIEVPNWAVLDNARTSKVMCELMEATWDFMDNSKPMTSAMYRTARDVQVFGPPKKTKKK